MIDIVELRRLATEARDTESATKADPDNYSKFLVFAAADTALYDKVPPDVLLKLLDVVEAGREARHSTHEYQKLAVKNINITDEEAEWARRTNVGNQALDAALAALDAPAPRNETDERGL